MAEVVLFHSVLGMRPGMHLAADRLRRGGHLVHMPDLYEGHAAFDAYEPAMEFQDSLGFPELTARAAGAVAGLRDELFFAGFSAGGALAEYFAASRAGARGAILVAAALPVRGLGLAAWPAAVPAQVHYAKDDPFREQPELEEFTREVRAAGAHFELHEYPGSGHLFADPDLTAEYDPALADLMWSRVLEFLARGDAGGFEAPG
ncbi:MAG: dienelactone hydrolase family protein [Candidatus Dormibacterales bacterium]